MNFSDADWAGNTDNRSSFSGFCFRLSESSEAKSWGCKSKKSVSTSTAEAEEFNSVVETSKKAIHLKLEDLKNFCRIHPKIFVDNQARIAQIKHSRHKGKN